jgi:hypothetical protein
MVNIMVITEDEKGKLLLKAGPSGRPSVSIIVCMALVGAAALSISIVGYLFYASPFIIAFLIMVCLYFYFRKPFIRIYDKGIDLPVSIFERSYRKLDRYISYTDIVLIYPFFNPMRFAYNLLSIGIETSDGRKLKINTEDLINWDGSDPGKNILESLKKAMGPQWGPKFQLVPPVTIERIESIKKAARFDYVNNASNGFTLIIGGLMTLITLRLLPLILQIEGKTTLTRTEALYSLILFLIIFTLTICFVAYGSLILKRGIDNWLDGANLYSQYNEYEEAKGLKILPILDPIKEDDWRMLSSRPPIDGEMEAIIRSIKGEKLILIGIMGLSFSLMPVVMVMLLYWHIPESLFLLFVPFIIMPFIKVRQINSLLAHVRLYKLLKGRYKDAMILKLKEMGQENYIHFLPRYWSVQSLISDDKKTL